MTSIDIVDLTNRTHALLTIIRKGNVVKQEVPDLMSELIFVLIQHNYLYYVEAQPIIADVVYDQIFAFLQSLEALYPEEVRNESPTQRLRVQLQDNFIKQDHGGYRLLSLKNSYSADDLLEWSSFIQRQLGEELTYTFLVEPKFDGSSVHIVYRYGRLVQAITRGDGYIGEDITQHVQSIHNIPLYVPGLEKVEELRLRGEIVMPFHAFEKLNKQQARAGGSIFANVRNATAGTLRQLDPRISGKRGLLVYIHDVIFATGQMLTLSTDVAIKKQLLKRGLPLYTRYKVCDTIEDVIALCTATSTKKYLDAATIDFDGLVVKINQIQYREQLGTTDHHPRWAMAYKFPAEQMSTRLIDVSYQIGRTGVITPVAELEPIQLSGATISRATLHNFDYIETYDIRRGDMVWVQRSGEVIPYILGPVKAQRTGEEEKIVLPEHCPSCASVLERKMGEVALMCPNTTNCIAQRKEQLRHFVSKYCVNITGLGSALIDMLVEQKLIMHWPDIWDLITSEKLVQLRRLPGIADKKIYQLTQEIGQKKDIPLRRLLHALGIPYIGKKIARVLETYVMHHVGSLDTISVKLLQTLLTDHDALHALYGLGPQSVDALSTYFTDRHYIGLLEQAEKNGIRIVLSHPVSTSSHGVLEDKTLVVTGSFSVGRDALSSLLASYGARVVTSITSHVDFVLVGENPGSKVKKAKERDIPLLSWNDLMVRYGVDELPSVPKKEIGSHISRGLFE